MKAQVTVYVILGIVIVATLAGVFILKDYVLKSEFERESEKFNIGDDFVPIYSSYQDCVESITLDGINIIASQGGYLEIPKYGYVVNPLIPFSNKLDVLGDENFEVAYWFYETGNGIQTEKIPSIIQMQQDIGKYVNENLFVCTSNFTGYNGYSINNFENFNTNIQIEDDKIFVEVSSNFNVGYKGVNERFDNVKVVVDSSLGYLYSKAVELYIKEKQENYFEEKTIDYLVVYDNIPYSGESFSCSPRVWSKQNVENDFKGILEANVDSVGKIDDSYHRIDLGDNNLDTSFTYRKDWSFFMEINGGEEILKEESAFGQNTDAANFLMALFCLNNYHFIYDIKYPILATLNKNGLDFNFAFEVIIDNNQPKENILGLSGLPEIDNTFCDLKDNKVSLYAMDYETEQLLNNVNIKLSCVGTSCDIGKTSPDNFGGYSLNENAPSCVNADIKSYKEGYHFGSLTLDTNEDVNSYIYMKKYHNLNVKVKVIDGNSVRNPLDDESIFVNFIDEEDGFSQFLNGDNINLVSGNYDIKSYIMKKSDKPIRIEGNSVESCADVPRSGVLGILGFKDKQCFTNQLEDVELTQVLVGGNEFEWSYDGIGNTLILYVTFDRVPASVVDMGNIYGEISKKERVRYPEII